MQSGKMGPQTDEKSVEVFVLPENAPKEDTVVKKPFFQINKEMLLFKAHFFLFVGAMGLTLPFMTIFAKTRIGLSGTSLGVLMTSQQFLYLFTKPLMGFIADYFNKLKGMICTLMVGFCIFSFLLLPIPHISHDTKTRNDGLGFAYNKLTHLEYGICDLVNSSDHPNSFVIVLDNILALLSEDYKSVGVDKVLDNVSKSDDSVSSQNASEAIVLRCIIGGDESPFSSNNSVRVLILNSSDAFEFCSHVNGRRYYAICADPNSSCFVHNLKTNCSWNGEERTINCSSSSEEKLLCSSRTFLLCCHSDGKHVVVASAIAIVDNSSYSEELCNMSNETKLALLSPSKVWCLDIDGNRIVIANKSSCLDEMSNDTKVTLLNASTACCCQIDGKNVVLTSAIAIAINSSYFDEMCNYTRCTFLGPESTRVRCCQIDGKSVVCPRSSDEDDANDFDVPQFWIFAFVFTVSMVCVNSMFTLSDTACCESVLKVGADFGRQRLYGAVGWGLMSMVGGLMFDYTGDYIAAFTTMGVMSVASLWNMSKLDLTKPQFSESILKDVGTVLKSKEFLVFELGVLLSGLGTSVMWFYHSIFLISIGASRFLCGLAQGVQCYVGEIPFMFYSGWFIKKWGHFPIIALTLLAYSIRFLWYSYTTNPWLVLPVEVIHGITYGLFYPTCASYAKKSAKPGTETTTQSIVFMTFEALGAGMGCIFFGIGFDYFGGHQMMFYASICSGCGMLIFIFLTMAVVRNGEKDVQVAKT